MPGAIARWDVFLGQIEARHRDVLAAAEAEGLRFIASIEGGGEALPLSLQLMAVRARLQDLETKIIDTWHGSVEDAIFEDGLGTLDRDREYTKGLALQRAIGERSSSRGCSASSRGVGSRARSPSCAPSGAGGAAPRSRRRSPSARPSSSAPPATRGRRSSPAR